MLKTTNGLALACIGLGTMLGYAAASGRLNPARWARAGELTPVAGACSEAGEAQPGCCDGVGKGELVALLNHNARVAAQAEKEGTKPNILVIWGDDIGTWNISHNNRGMMGYMTPNIDRIAKEGVSFTDYYGQQSCTAG